jgi:hypothetical protein
MFEIIVHVNERLRCNSSLAIEPSCEEQRPIETWRITGEALVPFFLLFFAPKRNPTINDRGSRRFKSYQLEGLFQVLK